VQGYEQQPNFGEIMMHAYEGFSEEKCNFLYERDIIASMLKAMKTFRANKRAAKLKDQYRYC